MLTTKELKRFKDALATAKNPLFFYDDDPDGLCSFLLLQGIHNEGKGALVRAVPTLDQRFLRKVEELQPDAIFILDVPIVEQEFIDGVKVPVFWLDHHGPVQRKKVSYFNPRLRDPDIYIPTTRMAYQINGDKSKLWVAMVGCLSDYHLPDFTAEFMKKYPGLLEKTEDKDKLIYGSRMGELIRVFSFLLKGTTSEVSRRIKMLAKIQSPFEILDQKTAQGKYLYKAFDMVNKKYEQLRVRAKKAKSKDKLLVFDYTTNDWSFTSELSGELAYLHPSKLVIVAREKSGAMRCSLRSKRIKVLPVLEEALVGVGGYGGGHEYACGANVQLEDWDRFLDNMRRLLKK